MFVDACAIISIMAREETADAYRAAMSQTADRFTSPLAAWEAIMVMSRPENLNCAPSDAEAIILEWLAENSVELREPIDPQAVLAHAVSVAQTHGVGKRALSSLDCFHYAHAKVAGAPMLTLDGLLRRTDLDVRP